MSIILDALNKLEKSGDGVELNKTPDSAKSNKTVKRILVYLIAVIIIFISLPKYLQAIKKPIVKKTASQSEPIVKQTPVSLPKAITKKGSPHNLVLNGIVFSLNENNYALVNNNIVQEGDKIKGFTVLEIKENEVELQREDSKIIKLSTSKKIPHPD